MSVADGDVPRFGFAYFVLSCLKSGWVQSLGLRPVWLQGCAMSRPRVHRAGYGPITAYNKCLFAGSSICRSGRLEQLGTSPLFPRTIRRQAYAQTPKLSGT
jgi:hypothetical protein